MKKIFYIFLLVVFFVLAFTFAQKNQQIVDVNYYAGLAAQAPMYQVIITTLSVGILIGYLISMVARMRTRSEMKQAKKQAKDATDRLQQLKNSQAVS